MRKIAFLFCVILASTNCITFAEHRNGAAEVLIPFSFGGKYGYLNSELQVVIKPQFTIARHFSKEGFAIVSFGQQNQAIIDVNGNAIIHVDNGQIHHIYRYLYFIRFNPPSLHRIIYGADTIIIRVKDKKIIARDIGEPGGGSSDGIINARIGERVGFIDFDGNRVLQHLNITFGSYSFFEQRAVINTVDFEQQIIDFEGNVVGDMLFKFLGGRFSEGLMPAMTMDGITGYINRLGEFEFTIPISNEGVMGITLGATNFADGHALVLTSTTPKTWHVINNRSQTVSNGIHAITAREFSEGFSRVSVLFPSEIVGRGGIWRDGFVNTRGEFLVRPILESADDFRNGFARIRHNGREGLLTTNGKVIWSSNIMQGIILEEELNMN